jgi:hypothetical protein
MKIESFALTLLVGGALIAGGASAMADEPGHKAERSRLIEKPARERMKHAVKVHQSYDYGFYGRGWAQGLQRGQSREWSFYPYDGRYYGNWPYRPRYGRYPAAPAVSGLIAAARIGTGESHDVPGAGPGSHAETCYLPVRSRYVTDQGLVIDRQTYICDP